MEFKVLIFTYLLFIGACFSFIRNEFRIKKLHKKKQLRTCGDTSKSNKAPLAFLEMRIYTTHVDTMVTLAIVDILLLAIYFIFFR